MKARYILVWAMMAALWLTACQEDDPLEPDPSGDLRGAFTGTWNCVENDAKIAYTVVIRKDNADTTRLLLENFAYIGMGEYAYATFAGTQLSVPSQIPCDGWQVQGSGKLINSNRMEWTYTVKVGGDVNKYTAVYTRMAY